MTCKYVKELIEELQRFNPEARLEQEVEVDGASPSTSCLVVNIDTSKDDRIAHLEGIISDIEESVVGVVQT